jgi:hypothetical protein
MIPQCSYKSTISQVTELSTGIQKKNSGANVLGHTYTNMFIPVAGVIVEMRLERNWQAVI